MGPCTRGFASGALAGRLAASRRVARRDTGKADGVWETRSGRSARCSTCLKEESNGFEERGVRWVAGARAKRERSRSASTGRAAAEQRACGSEAEACQERNGGRTEAQRRPGRLIFYRWVFGR